MRKITIQFVTELKQIYKSPIAKDGLWSIILKSTSTCLTFLATVFLARKLGASGYGVYAYAFALINLISIPAHAGLPDLVTRETAQAIALKKWSYVKGIWRWSGRMVALLSIFIVIILGPLFTMWQGGIQNIKGQTFILALLLVPLIALGNLRGAALRGLQHIVAGQIPEFLLRPAFFLLFIIGALLLVPNKFSAPLAMAMYVLASLLSFLIGAWMLWWYTPRKLLKSQPPAQKKEWLSSSLMFALIVGFSVINNQASTVILGIIKSPTDVGLFKVALQVGILASFVLQAINRTVAPHFADLYVKGEISRLQRLVTYSARVVLLFNLILTGAFITLGQILLPLFFGSEFAASYYPLLILLIGQIVNSAAGSVGYLLNMTGNEKETLRGVSIASGVNIVLNLTLIPFLGVTGAAIATAISMITWNVLLWWRVRTVLGINSLAFNIPLKIR